LKQLTPTPDGAERIAANYEHRGVWNHVIAATGADFKSVCTTPRIARTVKPEAKARAAYETAYGRYVQIYPSIREI